MGSFGPMRRAPQAAPCSEWYTCNQPALVRLCGQSGRLDGKVAGASMNAGTEGESGSEQSAAGGTGSPSRRRHAVFISDFVHLESSFDDVVPALLRS